MRRFNPVPKVKPLRYHERNMEQVNLQAIFDQIQNLEHRLGALQVENNNLQQQQQQLQQQRQALVVEDRRTDFFRIPDPIRMIPSFDGNKRQLSHWLDTARRALNLCRPHVAPDLFAVYEQAVINKIEGKARDMICVNGNPTTFDEVAEILQSVYGDRNNIATYQTQLWSLKMTESLHIYYKKTKEIMVNMKSLAKQNPTYANHWDAINHFLEQECLAAFINGLSKPYFGYAQTAQPSDLENAYAFLCRFQNAEKTKSHTQAAFDQQPHGSKNFKSSNKPFSKQSDTPSTRHKPLSDRQKMTPMEVDPSLRSRVYNHDAEQKNDDDTHDTHSEDDSEDEVSEQSVNFQIGLDPRSLT